MRAQAIVLPLPRRAGGSLFGKTVETVLAERPARVVLLSDPGDRSAGAARRRGRRARRARGGAALMPAPRNLHSGASQVLSAVMVLLGVAILVSTLARGGGPLALGVLLGVLFVAAGRRPPLRRTCARAVGHRRCGAAWAGRTLFAIVYTAVASSIYFSLGVVADHALGLTPFVFLLAGVFFLLAAMTYVEGASLHQDRGGSTVFARYAFNEVVSFIAGWAVLLDYMILVAVSAFSATNYLAAFWEPLGDGMRERLLAFAIVAYVAIGTIRGFSPRRATRVAMVVVADLGVQLLVVIVGLATFFHPGLILDPIQLGGTGRSGPTSSSRSASPPSSTSAWSRPRGWRARSA